mmetsp:Transcript_31707/g.46364  ORF Transcript_31707/g.46364 Transcript_31707/m.46364 type:complete len:171 (-) Transcript_31707:574-1086(-)
MKTSGLLIVCIFACLATAMDSSAEFHHLAFGPGVSVEGQFLASLAPQRDCVCSTNRQTAVPPAASAPRPSEEDGVADEVVLGGAEDDTQRYWHVLLHDDDEHTLDFAMETLEGVLRREAVGIVRRSKVQWIAYQAHHYGRGLVAVLPELRAQRAVRDLQQAGLACSLVPG